RGGRDSIAWMGRGMWLGGVVGYALVVEPFLRLTDQTFLWSVGFYLLIALIAACGLLSWRAGDRPLEPVTSETTTVPSWRDAAVWVALAAGPARPPGSVTPHHSAAHPVGPVLLGHPLSLSPLPLL